MADRMVVPMARYAENRHIFWPFAQPLFSHFGDPPLRLSGATGHFAGHVWLWARFPFRTAGQPSRKSRSGGDTASCCCTLLRNCYHWLRHRLQIHSKSRARERHINFEHINFLKVGTTLFGPVKPGTTSRLSQGHLDVNQSKKFIFMAPGTSAAHILGMFHL